MTNMHFCPKGPAICKISQQIVMKWGNSEQEKFLNDLISEESSWLTALFGVILPQRQNTNSQKMMTEKLSKSGLGRCI